jgi:hemerythrin
VEVKIIILYISNLLINLKYLPIIKIYELGGTNMALFDWNENLSVHVKQFDDQHKKLVKMLNDLHEAMKQGKGQEVLGKTLAELVNYTNTHFADEERLMKLHQYAGYEQHKKEHNMLVIQVFEVQKSYTEGKAVLTQAVMSFLKGWLQNHIQGEDKKYSQLMNSKGIF